MNFQANYPIYLQIAEDIKRRIVIGELKAGDKLPSNAELALAYQVNLNTVQRNSICCDYSAENCNGQSERTHHSGSDSLVCDYQCGQHVGRTVHNASGFWSG